MLATQTYDVLVDFICNGRACRKGSSIELTERQAKYLLLGNKIAQSKAGGAKVAKKDSKQKKEIKNG